MKGLIKYLLPLSLVALLGCEKSYPTYPNLDGEYVIDLVIANYEYLNQRFDTTQYSGIFKLPNPSSPLDSFVVGETRFRISYNNSFFYWNKGININGSPWDDSPFTQMDLEKNVYGNWENLYIHFWNLDGKTVRRPFTLLEPQSTEQFSIRMKQYPEFQMGSTDVIKYVFYKVGP